jgi:hypothetical protein
MSRLLVLVFFGSLSFLLLGWTSSADDATPKLAHLRVSDLNERPVIGELGIPLGTCCIIQAKVIAGRDLRLKLYDGVYLLSVTHVGDKQLATPVTLQFNPGTSVKLARDGFELHVLKTGKKAEILTGAKIRELEKDYVGTTMSLNVYETGGFFGIPRKMPEGREIWWAGPEFGFSTSLVVISERK